MCSITASRCRLPFQSTGHWPKEGFCVGEFWHRVSSSVCTEEIIVCDYNAETSLEAELKSWGRHSIDQKSGLWASMDKITWWFRVFSSQATIIHRAFWIVVSPSCTGFYWGSWCYFETWGLCSDLLLLTRNLGKAMRKSWVSISNLPTWHQLKEHRSTHEP